MKQKWKLAVQGHTGRMGRAISVCSEQLNEFQLELAITKDLKKSAQANLYKATGKPEDLSQFAVDIIIDFSSVQGSLELASELKRLIQKKQMTNKFVYVCGTTGFQENEMEIMMALGELMPVAWASNFSLGIGFLDRALRSAKLIGDFDFQIEETHHNKKVDSPSGTAKSLRTRIETSLGRKIREPISHRIGEVIGTHRVSIKGPHESVILEHIAHDRTVFAYGALKVGAWLIGKPKGFYKIEEYFADQMPLVDR